jgi:hypothetical protein
MQAPVTTFCHTRLNYAGPEGLTPAGLRAVEVEIADGRLSSLPDWSECGFQLIEHRSALADWDDDAQIAEQHYAEVEALAGRLTGCDVALVSDHVKRNAETARREREQAPVRLVHSDFAAGYDQIIRQSYRQVHGRGAATLARNGVSAAEIEGAPRLVMMQFWRNIGAPRMDLPVAFCDNRTLTLEDVVAFPYTGYVAGGRSFDALAVVGPRAGAVHGWYAFPDMNSDEVVAFRTYDTDLVARDEVYFTPHSAFRDPRVEEGNPARHSIELRVMCLFL